MKLHIDSVKTFFESSRNDSETDTITWQAPKKGHFKGREHYFSGLDFIARLTLHIPSKGKHLGRRYGIYSSRSRGTWKSRPALSLRAAEGWYGRKDREDTDKTEELEEISVADIDIFTLRVNMFGVCKQTPRIGCIARARLLAKVYEINIFTCPKCGGEMSVIALIRNHEEIRKIIACLEKQGRGPPG